MAQRRQSGVTYVVKGKRSDGSGRAVDVVSRQFPTRSAAEDCLRRYQEEDYRSLEIVEVVPGDGTPS